MFALMKSLPVRLLFCVMAAVLCSFFCDVAFVKFFYTLSHGIKELLFASLPLIVFSYIAASLLALNKGAAPLLILGICGMVTISNFFSVFVSYGIGNLFLPFILSPQNLGLGEVGSAIVPLWDFHIPSYVTSSHAMIAAIVVGVLSNFFFKETVFGWGLALWLLALRNGVTTVLQKIFIPFLLPFYIFGFVLKMNAEGLFEELILHYSKVLILFCVALVAYIFFLYLLGAGGRLQKALSSMKNMLPAGITGFSTLSSAVAMPVTLGATEKNVGDRAFAQLAIPSTVNIHMIGDAIGIPLLGFTVLLFWGQPLPSLESYLIFAAFFCFFKFSAVAVPGGGMFVLLPVLKEHMNLDDNMIALVQMLYLLQDPIFTCANVMGNGAFAMILQRLGISCKLLKKPVAVAS